MGPKQIPTHPNQGGQNHVESGWNIILQEGVWNMMELFLSSVCVCVLYLLQGRFFLHLWVPYTCA